MPNFFLTLTPTAIEQLQTLKSNNSLLVQYKSVAKALRRLEQNPRHPTHEFTSMSHELGTKVFEAYAQNNTPGAYRIFWHYGQDRGEIRIVAIIAHP